MRSVAGSERAGVEGSDAQRRALRTIERHGAAVMRVARRYSRNAHDAEDAYQRAVEILLTKTPDLPEAELVPWLKTVVKHEAFAVRRGGDRLGLAHAEPFEGDAPDLSAVPDERVEQLERLQLGAEALRRLKPQEVRCLLLKAEGYSYRQICEETGWTYTKVNRCLTEGRQSFRRTVAGIESGAECARLAPLLSRLADGEATAADMAALRPHLRSCLPCRAALRDFRAAPARVAAIAPPVTLGFGPLADRIVRRLDVLRGRVADAAGGGSSTGTGGVATAAGLKAAGMLAAAVAAAGGALVAIAANDRPVPRPVPAGALAAPVAAPAPAAAAGDAPALLAARATRQAIAAQLAEGRRARAERSRALSGQPRGAAAPPVAPAPSAAPAAEPAAPVAAPPMRAPAPWAPRRAAPSGGDGSAEFGP